jgi:hypothetical protein
MSLSLHDGRATAAGQAGKNCHPWGVGSGGASHVRKASCARLFSP